MDPEQRARALESLAFFGRINASVTHELKNVLAVINENAGLLQDLAAFADQGAPIDPERLRRAAGAVLGQVARGDELIKNLNAFAHCVDEPEQMLDLPRIVGLLVALCQRLAAMRCVTLVAQTEPVSVRGNAFFVLELLFQAIVYALEHHDAASQVTVRVSPTEQGACLSVAGLARATEMPGLPDAQPLARMLGATLDTLDNGGVLRIIVPFKAPS